VLEIPPGYSVCLETSIRYFTEIIREEYDVEERAAAKPFKTHCLNFQERLSTNAGEVIPMEVAPYLEWNSGSSMNLKRGRKSFLGTGYSSSSYSQNREP
jgi:hypothetical protein